MRYNQHPDEYVKFGSMLREIQAKICRNANKEEEEEEEEEKKRTEKIRRNHISESFMRHYPRRRSSR